MLSKLLLEIIYIISKGVDPKIKIIDTNNLEDIRDYSCVVYNESKNLIEIYYK